MVARRAGDLLESIGHVRLGAEIEFHIGVDREAVETLLADAPPFPVGFHESLIDPETAAFTDSALDRGQPVFDGFDGWVRHDVRVLGGAAVVSVSIALPPRRLQPDGRRICLTMSRGRLY